MGGETAGLMFVSLFGFVLIADLERRMGANAGRKYRQKNRCLSRKHLIWTFSERTELSLPEQVVGARRETRNSLSEEHVWPQAF